MPHFIVEHVIKQPDVWQANVQNPEEMKRVMDLTKESDYICESGYILDIAEKQFCLWYAKDAAALEKFPAFFHKNWYPETIADSSKYYVISDECLGAPTPPGAQFEQAGKGHFAFVHHKVLDHEKVKAQLGAYMSKGQDEQQKMVMDAGLWNHQFLPSTGATEKTDMFCLWELKEGKTAADLKSFIDKNLLTPESCENVVFTCSNGNSMNIPTSKFVSAA